MLIGYATVSTTEQDTSLQLAALRRHGVRKVFEEQRLALAHRAAIAGPARRFGLDSLSQKHANGMVAEPVGA